MKKNYSILVALLLIAALFLGACTGGANNEGEKQEGNQEKDVTISFIHWRGEDTDAFNEIIAKFQERTQTSKYK